MCLCMYMHVLYTMGYFSPIKKKDENLAICDNVDEAGHYAK